MIMKFKEKSREIKTYIDSQNEGYVVKEVSDNIVPYDFVLSKMDVDSQRIIYCDYIVKQPKYWYRTYYSKSTYYRLKNKAMDEFLKLVRSL